MRRAVPVAMAAAALLAVGCTSQVGSDASTSSLQSDAPGDLPAEVEVLVLAEFQGEGVELNCPPICMDGADMSTPSRGAGDDEIQMSFEMCSPSTGCYLQEAGSPAVVASDATIRAPDGISRGQQLPAFEQDNPLVFEKWSDGVTQNPRTLTSGSPKGNPVLEFVAIYHIATLSDPTKEASQAGCPSSQVDLFFTNQQWVEVEKRPEMREIEGPVTGAYQSHEDWKATHYTPDYIMWVLLEDDKYFDTLATKGSQRGQRQDQLHVEWETGSYPEWARPYGETIGPDESGLPQIDSADRVWMTGKWIFDCGHPDDAIAEGAWTEIHPPIAVATMRGVHSGKPFLRVDLESVMTLRRGVKMLQGVKVDFWVNGDGGLATEILNGVTSYDIQRQYEFTVPLPPPPEPPTEPGLESKFVYETFRLEAGQPEPDIQVVRPSPGDDPTALEVKVDLSDYTEGNRGLCEDEGLSNCDGDSYGFTIVAGWEVFTYPPDYHRIRMQVDNVRVFDDWEGEDGDGEWKLDLEVGPGSAIAGALLGQSTSISLEKINTGLYDAPQFEGQAYPLVDQDGSPLILFFNVREDPSLENDHLGFRLEGIEEDPVWDDRLPTMERQFYWPTTNWLNGLPPEWANCTAVAACPYGAETEFGATRPNDYTPVDYEDGVPDSATRTIGDQIISLRYEIQEVAPEP